MKVVILGSASSSHIPRWANSLADRGIDVYLMSIHPNRELLNSEVSFIKLNWNKPFGYIANIPQVKSLIEEINPDLIHSFYALGYGTLGALSGYKPHILSVMGSDIYDDINNPFLKPFVLNNIRKASIVCSTSKTMALKIENITGLNRFDIEYTPFGIDSESFIPKKRSPKKKIKKFTFGTVKFLEDKYGIDILLRAFALYKNQNPNIDSELVIVGDGSKESSLKKLAKSLGIYDNCKFEGFQKHSTIPDYLNTFDVYMALSRLDSESFGVAILEASACELPVIVSNVGGLPEVVANSVTGFIVEKENPKAASVAMSVLAKNSELRLKFGKAGRERVISEYEWSKSVNNMISIYNKFL